MIGSGRGRHAVVQFDDYVLCKLNVVSWSQDRSSVRLTVLLLTNNEDRDDGILTKQFFKCTRDISAEVAWLLRLFESGAMI